MGRESGQIPIIISFLTHQEFLGVLIDLVPNGGAVVAFFGMLFTEQGIITETCLCRTRPNLCSHLLH